MLIHRLLIVLFALGAFAPLRGNVVEAPRVNVVVILADDLGYGDLSCKGGAVPTPHLDRLIAQGVEIETFLVQPVCSPTRAALLTGRDPARVGVNPRVINARQGELMDPSETTLAEIFQSAGYRTGIIGKWHLGYAPSSPNLKGFDHFYGFLGAATDYLARTDDPHTQWMLNENPQPDPGYSTDLIRDGAIRFIDDSKASPFFLYVSFNAVHNPVQSTNDYIARVPASITDDHARARAGMLVAMDDAVGAIVKKIDDDALAERTIIVFFSDNGPTPDGSAGPFRGRKHTVYEGGVRSPAVVRWTAKLPTGGKTSAMVAAEDLFPTLLNLTGVAIPPHLQLDGQDFSACLTSDAPSPRQQRTWLWFDCDAIRTDRHKLIRYADRRELYDLRDDISESRNLVDERPDLAADLERRLDEWQASVPIYPSHVPLRNVQLGDAEPAGTVLEIRASRERGAAQPLAIQLGQCERFQLRSGDRLEYDIRLAPGSSADGISFALSAPAPQRPRASRIGSVEAAPGPRAPGASAHWTRQALGLANSAPRQLSSVWLILDSRAPANYHLHIDNVVVRRADGTVIELYRDGEPPGPRRQPPGYSNVSVQSIPAPRQ